MYTGGGVGNILRRLNRFRQSDVARDWFGDHFVAHFAATREREWHQWLDDVIFWGPKRTFEIIRA